MLICGIINELEKRTVGTTLLSYFFCQATDSRINNAIAVLRGLLYMLVDQQPSLVSHMQKKYDHVGKALFEDTNAWITLSEIFTNVLQDPSLNDTYIIVDALDECVTDLPKLLSFVVQNSSLSSPAKWIFSSRNWPSIEKHFNAITKGMRLSLELNENSVSAAVATYIQFKVDWLAKQNDYNYDTRDVVQQYLSLNANGTFLWVALVCQELSNAWEWEVKEKLTTFPPGLDTLYKRMMDQIKNLPFCKQILSIVSTVYRPVTLGELSSFIHMPDGVSGKYEALSKIIALCGSFLTLRGRTVAFVHQSAKDFLVQTAYDEIYPSKAERVHYTIYSRSLQAMSKVLREKDIYKLGAPGFSIHEVQQPDPDPLFSLKYSCVHWIGHLLDCNPTSNATSDLQDDGPVDEFLRCSYLYWLEALSLCRNLSEGIVSIARLEALLQVILSPAITHCV